ncbi:LapA family protein [Arthrobacter sp. NQ7]|uniref:LapA family protein n=1 Tax=Arthrobacter sp. NQ7 TaxID=3032303 RepID=UPI00240F6706|nr:LapA family protein [Arthrobacter sp. NQ7]MDJ0457491.1 LapA family protein [Arthrobacter sp. NQ7]
MSAGQSTPTPDRQPESEPGTVQPTPTATSPGRPAGYGNAPAYRADGPETTGTGPTAGAAPERKVTRAGVIWAAVVAALVLLILLIVFILQNQELVLVKFLGFEGSVPLGMALFIAAVTGGVLVAVAGGARILQLRSNAHRDRARQRR